MNFPGILPGARRLIGQEGRGVRTSIAMMMGKAFASAFE